MSKRYAREIESEGELMEGIQPYAIGWVAVPFQEIIGWHDGWRKGVDINDVIKKGFDSTIVLTSSLGEFHFSWNMSKFEKNYDAFGEKLEEYFSKYSINLQDIKNNLKKDEK